MGDGASRGPLDRRGFLAFTGGSVVAGALGLGGEGCSKKEVSGPAVEAGVVVATAPANAAIVRVASVKTAVEGNVLPTRRDGTTGSRCCRKGEAR